MRKLSWISIFFILFIFPKIALATSQSVTISNISSSIDQLQEFSADVVLYCSSCADSYLRGVFYQSGTSYFGYTQDNTGSWSNAAGGNCNAYFKISQDDLKDGSFSGKLRFKPDIESSYYKGPGEYSFKVGRYSPSCSSPVWSSETTIAISGPTPTPTSSQTLAQSPTNTPTPTSKPTPTTKPILTRALSITKIPTSKVTEMVLAQSTKSAINKRSQKNEPKQKVLGTSVNFSKIFISFGLIILISCGILIFLKLRRIEN
ncbi:MAG: hypothetical protein A2W22_06455 [Candidatus Levybacteria bacterium RBG_16_35_11]|nr:MAG: hypothetical protein A2W22_06455 [Candidatus Levybacteria bacterium RBG_16_35_11]